MFEQFANIIVYQMAYQWLGLDAGSHTAAAVRQHPVGNPVADAGIYLYNEELNEQWENHENN